jgi:hypothetical protein
MSNEIIDFNAELAALAKLELAKERPTSSNISFKSGMLAYNGTPIPGNKLDCIIISSTHANTYFPDRYDPDNLSDPVCFAYGDDEATMAPHADSSQPQHTSCYSCPKNAFGSADNGKGKACKNSRHLALIPAGTEAQDIVVAEVAVAKLPVTSVKNFGQYVQKVSALYNRPALGVVTEISLTPDAKSQFKVNFQVQGMVADEMLAPLIGKRADAAASLIRVYAAPVEAAPAAPAKKGKY